MKFSGRTFPNHSYFMSPLGPGQLGLYNLLKAYSLLDEEVGYCQGLSFIAGILLLHVRFTRIFSFLIHHLLLARQNIHSDCFLIQMSEDQAFIMLRHLMFRRNLRQQYLPDMAGLQVQLYQLTRLLKDYLPELYEHFDKHEISPILYAAPWILTIFASQFPLGFVVRVFGRFCILWLYEDDCNCLKFFFLNVRVIWYFRFDFRRRIRCTF